MRYNTRMYYINITPQDPFEPANTSIGLDGDDFPEGWLYAALHDGQLIDKGILPNPAIVNCFRYEQILDEDNLLTYTFEAPEFTRALRLIALHRDLPALALDELVVLQLFDLYPALTYTDTSRHFSMLRVAFEGIINSLRYRQLIVPAPNSPDAYTRTGINAQSHKNPA